MQVIRLFIFFLHAENTDKMYGMLLLQWLTLLSCTCMCMLWYVERPKQDLWKSLSHLPEWDQSTFPGKDQMYYLLADVPIYMPACTMCDIISISGCRPLEAVYMPSHWPNT